MAETDKLNDNLEILLKEKKYLNALYLVQSWEKSRRGSSKKISGKLLLSLSQTYYFNNLYEKSKEYLSLYEKMHSNSCQGREYIRHKYRLLILEERAEQAIEFIRDELKRPMPESERYWLFLYLGKAHFWNGDYLDANRYFQKCYMYYLASNDNYMLGHTLYMMGYLTFQRSVFKDAEGHFNEALKNFRSSNKIHQAAHCLKMLSVIKYRTGRFHEAQKDLHLAKKDYQKLCSSNNVINCRLVLARIQMFQSKYDACKRILKETYRKAGELNHRRAQALSAEFLGEISYRKDQYKEAENWLEKALKLAEESAPRGDVAVEVYRRLADVKIALGQFSKADEMLAKA
ncbi:MAG: tetratricopeptide repeat protein, partial [Candidatus Latescibacteria bacterium]|nr:tetratricopeptide repeat protein [Candidatus Latescibacterota bacterium]